MAQFYPSDFSVLSQAGANMAQNQLRNGETMANIGKSAVDIMSNVMDTKQKADSSAEALIQLGMMKPEEALTMSPAQVIGKHQAVLQKNALADMVIGQQAKAFQLQQQQQQAQRDNMMLQGLINTNDSQLDPVMVQAKQVAVSTGDPGVVKAFINNASAAQQAAKNKQDLAILESGLKQQQAGATALSGERKARLAQNLPVENATEEEKVAAQETRKKSYSEAEKTFAISAETVDEKADELYKLVNKYGNIILYGSSPEATRIRQLKADLAVMYSKMLDAGSVVREPEVERFYNEMLDTNTITRPEVTLENIKGLKKSVMQTASKYPKGLFNYKFQQKIKEEYPEEGSDSARKPSASSGEGKTEGGVVRKTADGRMIFFPDDMNIKPYAVK